MAADAYAFHPMSQSDLPRVRRWLEQPEVAAWWGDPDTQYALVSGDLSEPAMAQYIVAFGERPFAYLQCYDPGVWPAGGLGAQPPGTRGIDQFIGESELIGRGHGSAFMRSFVDGLLRTGTPRVVTDPAPANRRAIRACEKAGFRKERLVETSDGQAILMVREA